MEKFDDWVDDIQIGRFDRQDLSGFTWQCTFVFAYLLKHSLESRSTKEPKHHLNAEIGLGGLNPATTEKPCEIGGGWIGSIQLSERGYEE